MNPGAERMDGRDVRRTAMGFGIGAALFVLAALYQNSVVAGGPFSRLDPVLTMGIIGGTVGGLTAPLIGGLVDRWRRR